MFRASLITSANRCEATWLPEAQAKPLAFTVRDISVDGVGLRVGLAAPELPQRGEVLEGVQMNFGDLGRLVANRSAQRLSGIRAADDRAGSGPGRTRAAPRVADGRAAGQPPRRHLPEPGRAPENWLQQVVWRLEKAIGTRSPKRCALPQGAAADRQSRLRAAPVLGRF